jgi:hypothetical protein
LPSRRAVGAPVGRGYYVIYVRKGETALLESALGNFLQVTQSDPENVLRRPGDQLRAGR